MNVRPQLGIGLVLAALPLWGCAQDDVADAGPPEVIGLRFLDGFTLEVTFSEPTASVDDVDPDIFRLSAAFFDGTSTTYYDLGTHFDGSVDETAPLPTQIPVPRGFQRHYIAEFIEIELDEDDHAVMRLVNSLAVDGLGACEAVATADDARLMLHYSDFWEPRITDKSGEPLADLGSHWVRSIGMKVEQGRYPFMSLDMPIPCP